jgi:beta propeller repeat protein/parallel beta-helix repeat protein
VKIEINNTRKLLIPLLLLAAVFLLIGSASATPVANASVDQSLELGTTVTLNGTASSDPDGGPITYNWTLSDKPSASVATIQNPTTNNPTFTPDLVGFYTFKLVVTDQYGVNSTPDYMELLTFKNDYVTGAGVKYGRYVVYSGGTGVICLYDVFTSQERRIMTTNFTSGSNLNFYGNNIVWFNTQNGISGDVYSYNIETGIERRITPVTINSVNAYTPGIYEDKIVYCDDRNGNMDIWLYDLSTGIETQITYNTEDQRRPNIYGDIIVWYDLHDWKFNVYMYNITTGVETRICSSTYNGYQERTISLNDRYIVWEDERNLDYIQNIDIYKYDIQNGIETPVCLAQGMQVHPQISGDNIVWYDQRNGQYFTCIYLYNIRLGVEFAITKLDTNPNGVDVSTPKIDDNHIVYMFISENFHPNFVITMLGNEEEPQFDNIGDKVLDENQTLQFFVNGSDSDGNVLTYSANNLPVGATFNGNNFSWIPSYIQAGAYIVTFEVSDGIFKDTETINILVNNISGPPILDVIGSKTVVEGQNLNFVVSASDNDGDILTYTTSALPVGASFNNGIFDWTPTYDQSGTYSVIFTVSDGTMTESENVTINVTDFTNMPPYVYFESENLLLGDSELLDGGIYSGDPDQNDLVYNWSVVAPIESQFTILDPSTVQQIFTPDVTGRYDFTLMLTDIYGASASYIVPVYVYDLYQIYNNRTGESYASIQAAIDDSDEGDTILVANGSYRETIFIEYVNVNLQANGDNVILESADGQSIITVNAARSRISGFIMTGAYEDAALRLGYDSESEITGNSISNNYIGIFIEESYIGHTITQNNITGNVNNGINGYNAHYVTIDGNNITSNGNVAIHLDSASDITITNNNLTGNGDGILANGLDYGTISGNNISENSQRGISATSVFDSEITENIINNNVDYGIELYSGYNVSITRNVITNTEGFGLQFDGDFSDVTLHFNQISGNGLDLYYYNSEGQTLQAENNWWGSNNEPTNIEDPEGLVSYSPWLLLNLSADPEEIMTGESSTLTADLTENSDGEDTSSEGTLPDGVEVNFTSTSGTIDSSANTSDGKATANFTSDEAGVTTISAAVDTEEVETTVNVTENNHPPVLATINDQNIAEGETLHLVLDATDPDGDSLTYSISSQPPESSFDTSTGTFTWTPRYEQSGSYTVTFTVSDGDLSTSQTITITVENTNRAPEMQTIGDKSVYEGQTIEFEVEATDPDGQPLTYSLDMLPPGASFDTATGIFTWTPTYQQSGPNLLTFTVTDGELSDSETIHLDVVNVNMAPVLNPVADQSIPEGQMLEFTVEGTDPDGQALTYTAGYSIQDLIQLGAVFNFETRTFTWTPSFDQAGSYTIPFTVSDGELTDTKLVNIVVQNTNRMPILMAIGNKDAYENQNLQFSVDALDPDGDSLTYSAADLPTGATFDSATRIFSWTPGTGQSGTYTVTFTVSDGNLPVSETITINVFNTPSGSGVSVSPVDVVSGQSPVTISFSSVLAGGTTTVSTSGTGSEPPAGFMTGEPPLYYEISTTASYLPPVTLAIHYDESMFSDESALRLFHYENGAWADVTTSQDTVNNIIYGSVNSLSPFAVFEPLPNSAPTAVLDGPYAAYEGSEITFDGSASYDHDGDALTYEWDLDGDGIFETTGVEVSKTWLDDYTGTVSLRVTDTHGLFNVASSTVTVTNTAPTATLSSSFFVKVPITMRVAGQPGNSVELQIIQDGVVIASKTIVFTAGSPNEQEVSLVANIDMSKTYTGRLVFSTGSQTSGATPVWLVIDGKKTKVATFKSNANNPATWSQSLNIPLEGLFTLANKEITFDAQATDSGADTLTFEWSFGDGTPLVVNSYTSDGTTVINDSVAHTYLQPGTYQLLLTVRDDEGAEVTYQMEVRVQ